MMLVSAPNHIISLANIIQFHKEYSLLDMLLTGLPREMSIYTGMTLIPLALIAHILTPGLLDPFQQPFILCTKSRVRRHFIPSMNSKVDLSILGADWLVFSLNISVVTLEVDYS